ncbi:hypothetical protein ATL39_0911 [Sinobaca qinghaiensis]|uniref:Uncharacterized protein n=1 Tax=Sinobaca qinghaiensis TaxID=342944 RepID=A0A419V5E9_9BACL|nr:hypothetical protein ATL39_0911 [Sinobaca qinghaiensis]
MAVIHDDKRNWPPEVRQYQLEERQRRQGLKIGKLEKLLEDPENGLLARVKVLETEVARWIDRENWWKGILNKIIVGVVVAAALAVFGRIGTWMFGIF